MKRLVYRPKVWAYIKTDTQAIDVSSYIVSGSVSRIVNDVSTAKLVLRNPDFKFTQPGAPTFRPMDPITIYMARDINHPVRVFTGFLDTTPYLQIFPGTITLEASCTLKRLKYTYWDPALPFSKKFLYKFGWQPSTDGQAIKWDADTKNTLDKQGKLNDGGFQNLLFGILEAVGRWNEKDIFIEELPPSIVPMVTKIFTSFKKENKETAEALKAFLEKVIGTTAAGASAASTGGTGSGDIVSGQLSATALNWDLTGKGSYFGTSRKYGIVDDIDDSYGSQKPSSGLDPDVAGIATRRDLPNHSVKNLDGQLNWWVVRSPDGKSAALPQTDWGPGAKTGCIVDVNTPAAIEAFGYSHTSSGVSFPDAGQWRLKFMGVGKDGKKKAEDALGGRPADKPAEDKPSGPQKSGGHAKPKEAPTVAGITGLTGTSIAGATALLTGVGSATQDATTPEQDKGVKGAKIDHSGRQAAGKKSSSEDAKALATKILTYEGTRLTHPLATTSDGVSARWVLEQVSSKGYSVIKSSASTKGVGTKVNLSVNMLTAIDEALSNGINLPINCLTNGQHSSNSNHYNGDAVDFDGTMADKDFQAFDKIANKYGGSHNFENPTNNGHWHYDFTGGATGGTDPNTEAGATNVTAGLSKDAAQGIATASAFATNLELPTEAETLEAIAYSGQKSYLNDKPLIEFIMQLCKASMRSFQSLPDGRFYAFFPDYFGTFNPDRPPYWEVDDIEITQGEIMLSDDTLATHVYVVGDTVYDNQINWVDNQQTAGIVTIFNAFETNWLLSQKGTGSKVALFKDATSFLSRYGVRPHYDPEPMIRSPFFEAFHAMNTFMLLWSRQFLTQFNFTFMPEIYPGGRIAFRDHDLVCYVDSVTHQFDYRGGFETYAQLSAPSAADTNNDSVMSKITYGMVRSF